MINGRSFLVSGAYFPPNCSISSYKIFTNTLENLVSARSDHLFICCGDFNLPDIRWSNDNLGLVYSSNSEIRVPCLPESFALLNFFQINNIVNSYGKPLDLVFVRCPHLSVSKTPDSLVPEDRLHPALSIDFHSVDIPPIINSSTSYFDFKRADVEAISHFFLSYNWSKTLLQSMLMRLCPFFMMLFINQF